MDFLIHLPVGTINRIDIHEPVLLESLTFSASSGSLFLSRSRIKKDAFRLESNSHLSIIIGDFIKPSGWSDNRLKDLLNRNKIPEIIHSANGHYYIIHILKDTAEISVHTSIFSILPVYYYQDPKCVVISSDLLAIILNAPNDLTVNKKYLLEKLLFNYPLFAGTLFNEIKTLEANTSLFAGEKLEFCRHMRMEDLFCDHPSDWRNSGKEMAYKFIKSFSGFIPDEHVGISLTGGFDSRTLVSVAYDRKADFSTYCFGNPGSTDMRISAEIALILGIKHNPILFDREYSDQQYEEKLGRFLRLTEGNASLSRIHYLEAAEVLKESTNYILTGNFGSELFRAMHHPGAMISHELMQIFQSSSQNVIKSTIQASLKMAFLNVEQFRDAVDELISELQIYLKERNDYPQAFLFYKFVFEEIFRKYFGPEIVMQRGFFHNRTPFLSFDFIRALFNTDFPGAYSKLFEKNPVKRFKGQVLYSIIMESTCPDLLKIPTGRRYGPGDLVTGTGRMRIFLHYLNNKFLRNLKTDADPYAIHSLFQNHRNVFHNLDIDDRYFNKSTLAEYLNKSENLSDRTTLYHILSICYFLNKGLGIRDTFK